MGCKGGGGGGKRSGHGAGGCKSVYSDILVGHQQFSTCKYGNNVTLKAFIYILVWEREEGWIEKRTKDKNEYKD